MVCSVSFVSSVQSDFPLKCYETHTCFSGQRERGREEREGGVHHHKLNVGPSELSH